MSIGKEGGISEELEEDPLALVLRRKWALHSLQGIHSRRPVRAKPNELLSYRLGDVHSDPVPFPPLPQPVEALDYLRQVWPACVPGAVDTKGLVVSLLPIYGLVDAPAEGHLVAV